MVGAFFPLSLQILFDANALPIRAGQILLFDAQTATARSGYEDANLTTPYPSPIETDGVGRIPPIWVGPGPYKVTLNDASGSLLATVDNLPGGDLPSTASTPEDTVVGTGMVLAAHTDDTFDGWLPLNGNTIGNEASAATARADVDTQALFIKLWNKDATLTVSGGRGVSATADYTAEKTIALPDYRGRVLAGVDGMGSSLAGLITAASTPGPNTIGTQVGGETEILAVGQLPAFTPQITIENAGSHTHTGTTDVQGSHQHGGTTSQDPGHVHVFQQASITNGISGGGYGAVLSYANANTATGGSHAHTISTDMQGSHQHAVTTLAAGDHTHTATAAAIGQGQAHANMQPTILVYWHIKL